LSFNKCHNRTVKQDQQPNFYGAINATNAKEAVFAGSGHWLMEERPGFLAVCA